MKAVVYHMSPGYGRTVAWLGNPKTLEREVIMTRTPDKGLSRRERYHLAVQFLRTLGVESFPEYIPSKAEP